MEFFLAPENLFELGSINITNTLFTSFIVFFLIIVLFALLMRKLNMERPGAFQLLMEMLIEGLIDLSESVVGKEKARKLFSFLFTFFIFILISNCLGVISLGIPAGVNFEASTEHVGEEVSFGECIKSGHCYLTLGGVREFGHTTHLFRPPTSDLSATLALAVISIIATNAIGLKELGGHYLKKYINLPGPGTLKIEFAAATREGGIKKSALSIFKILFDHFVDFFVGILEAVSEISKIISFSFRLLGNIFAGEILLAVVTSISLGIATLPFLGLEVFVGFIQAFVFFILTAAFIGLAITPHEQH